MTYNSKSILVSMGAGVLMAAVYIVYALGGSAPAPDDLKSWAIAMLIFIGACIVAGIIIQILFHIAFAIGVAVKERENDRNIGRIIASSTVEDEMKKLIDLKSSRIGYVCSGIGFLAALVSLAFGMTAIVALHIIFASIAVGSLIEGSFSIYLHERGVNNG